MEKIESFLERYPYFEEIKDLIIEVKNELYLKVIKYNKYQNTKTLTLVSGSGYVKLSKISNDYEIIYIEKHKMNNINLDIYRYNTNTDSMEMEMYRLHKFDISKQNKYPITNSHIDDSVKHILERYHKEKHPELYI